MRDRSKIIALCALMAMFLPPLFADQSAQTVSAYTSFAAKVGVLNTAIAQANHDVSRAEVLAALTDFADGLGDIVASMRSAAAGRAQSDLSPAEQSAIQKAQNAMAALQEIPKTFQWCIGASDIHTAWVNIVSIITGS